MHGTEFIDLVLEHVGSEFTRPKAVTATNNAQNELLASRNLKIMRILPDPFLTTVAGTFQYQASDALFSSVGGVKGSTQWDIRTVTRIYGFNNDQRIFAYNSEDIVSERPYEAENGMASSEVRAVEDVTPSIKPLESDCSIYWWEDQDPGATTVDWRAIAYRWPTQFLSETVDLEVPVAFQDTLLLYKVLQRAGIKQYGSPSRGIQELIDEQLVQFLKLVNARTTSKKRRTLPSEV